MEAAIIGNFPLFDNYEKKEEFSTVLGLLFTKHVTFAKAAELLEMSREEFSKILKLMGLEYSYLTKGEARYERAVSGRL